MANKSEQNSFRRRKVIEDSAPQRRAEALASTQNGELSNIGSILEDSQAATEMVAEAIERQTGEINQGFGGIGDKIDDVIAANELTAENTEAIKNQSKATTGAARLISQKLGDLSAMLSEKFAADPTRVPQAKSTAIQAVEEQLPMPVEEPKLRELLEQLIPGDAPKEDAPFLPPPTQPGEPADDRREKKNDNGFNLGSKVDDLLKTSKKGFGAVVSVTDRIAGMLFKYTVTAVAQAAKFAGMMFALVLGIDMIQVYFQYFMKQFEASWSEFDKKFEEWGPLISGLMTMAKNIEQMFSEKNWLGMAKAIGEGVLNGILNLADLMMLGLGKLTAAMLRAMGFTETADSVEGGALYTYANNSGGKLDDEDSLKLAKYEDKRDEEEFNKKKKTHERFNNKNEGLGVAQYYGTVTPETAEKIKNNDLDTSIRDMPEAERLDYFKKRREAESSIKRLESKANELYTPDETDKKNFKEEKERVETLLKDPDLKNESRLQKLMKQIDTSAKKFDTPIVKPQPAETKEEVVQTKRIDGAQRAKEANSTQSSPQLGNLVQQVNVQKNNKTMYNMPPQTSSPAPGMHRSVNVN